MSLGRRTSLESAHRRGTEVETEMLVDERKQVGALLDPVRPRALARAALSDRGNSRRRP
jgi:hypothetical protein